MGAVYYATPLVAIVGFLMIMYYLADLALNVRCQQCGQKNGKRKVFCDRCGSNLTQQFGFQESQLFDRKTLILSFFVPFVGLYLWFFMKDTYPHKSRYMWTTVLGGTVIIAFNAYAGAMFGYYNFWYFY